MPQNEKDEQEAAKTSQPATAPVPGTPVGTVPGSYGEHPKGAGHPTLEQIDGTKK
jgi:hypothetical protein